MQGPETIPKLEDFVLQPKFQESMERRRFEAEAPIRVPVEPRRRRSLILIPWPT